MNDMNDSVIERLVDENTELVKKIVKLDNFISSDMLTDISDYHIELLENQLEVMTTYSQVLDMRIKDLKTVGV